MLRNLLNFVGGAVGRVVAAALLIGAFMVIAGITPGEWVADRLANAPPWLRSGWLQVALLILGLAIIATSLHFNRWSRKQKAVDGLAEDLSFAINDLLNRQPRPSTGLEVETFERDFHSWCNRVSAKLENRAFFSRADQLHFDRLGFVQPIQMAGVPRLDWLLSMLRLKFDRLRDVINWAQQRR